MRVFELGMETLLAASVSHFQGSATESAVNVRDALREASDAIDWPSWQNYWNHIGPLIEGLPRILQHGDLAVNNIAVAGGELVFFDWEDFGLLILPDSISPWCCFRFTNSTQGFFVKGWPHAPWKPGWFGAVARASTCRPISFWICSLLICRSSSRQKDLVVTIPLSQRAR